VLRQPGAEGGRKSGDCGQGVYSLPVERLKELAPAKITLPQLAGHLGKLLKIKA
jgi:hypothetical protein